MFENRRMFPPTRTSLSYVRLLSAAGAEKTEASKGNQPALLGCIDLIPLKGVRDWEFNDSHIPRRMVSMLTVRTFKPRLSFCKSLLTRFSRILKLGSLEKGTGKRNPREKKSALRGRGESEGLQQHPGGNGKNKKTAENA